MVTYSLTINRYGRHMDFNNLERLKEELGQYFTQKEKETGIIDRLTKFEFNLENDNGFQYLFAKNNYQDFTVCCYEDIVDPYV